LYKARDRVYLALRSLQNRRWTGYLSETQLDHHNWV